MACSACAFFISLRSLIQSLMITEITPLNFPEGYLSKATVNDTFMGEKTITASIKVPNDLTYTPDFKDWAVLYKGEKYILPIRKPQGVVENKSLNTTYELTFQHFAIYQLKRYLFAEMAEVGTDKVIPDKYEASLGLNIKDFVKAFDNVLEYYYHGSITIELKETDDNGNPITYPLEPQMVSISKSKVWEVLQQLYDVYAVTWFIEPTAGATDNEHYTIKVGYKVQEINHLFEYGFNGGLLKVERQVQSTDITNILLGRGGEKNLPYRYFKKSDDKNTSFKPDPDWIPELANVYFDRLHDSNFRYYVQGWKDAHYWIGDNTDAPNFDINAPAEGHRPSPRYNNTAKEYEPYYKGYTDTQFDPIEYVRDEMSITEYGELWGCAEDNDEIYPTIQGVIDPERPELGRVDEVVEVEQITDDNIEQSASESANQFDLPDIVINETHNDIVATLNGTKPLKVVFDNGGKGRFSLDKEKIKEQGGSFLVFDVDVVKCVFTSKIKGKKAVEVRATPISITKYAMNLDARGRLDNVSSVEGGATYVPYAEINFPPLTPEMEASEIASAYFIIEAVGIKYGYGKYNPRKIDTFDIWIKDIWNSGKPNQDESDKEFVERIWKPILGDREKNEAAVVFSTGFLSTSEDYEFKILGGAVTNGVHYDTHKIFEVKDGEGNAVLDDKGKPIVYRSMWRLTLIKSDADLESTGKYVPSTQRQGKAGDTFFFIGIDMPHQYVLWAEERLHQAKITQLQDVADIKPQWNVTLDKVRIQELIDNGDGEEATSLIEQIKTGAKVKLRDDRLLKPETEFYIKSLTTEFSNTLYPNVTITLEDKLETTHSTLSLIQGEVSALSKQFGALGNIEALVRVVGDKLYLRKDGKDDTSYSSSEFYNIVKSNNFTQGRLGGSGWALYRDGHKNTVLEVDRAIIRESMEVTELVVHQTEYVGGSRIESAASITCSGVNPVNKENDEWKLVLDETVRPQAYQCYFDTKQGTVRNLFKVDDVAYSSVFDPSVPNVKIKYYKRRVLAIGTDYIVLSNDNTIKVRNGADDYDMDGDGKPEVGDVIIHYGNYEDPTRQYVKVSDVIDGGYERFLQDLNTAVTDGTEYYFAGRMVIDNNLAGYRFFIGKRDEHYIEWQNGKLAIKGELSVDSKIGNDSFGKFVDDRTKDLAKKIDVDNLKKQVDGKIDTWYHKGEPLPSSGNLLKHNYPAEGWSDEDKAEHLDDLYYDKDTKCAYIYTSRELPETIAGGTRTYYYWDKLQDTDIAKALEDASKAQATADGKMTVFQEQPTYQQSYDEGDLWLRKWTDTSKTPNQQREDIYTCIKAKPANKAFSMSDWALASNYDATEVTIANGIVTAGRIELYGGDAKANPDLVKAGIDGAGTDDKKIRIWAGSTYTNNIQAPFRVNQAGELWATKANIEGSVITPQGGLSNEVALAIPIRTMMAVADNSEQAVSGGANSGGIVNPPSQELGDPNPIRFWAGSDYDGRKNAPFRVRADGSVFMNNAKLEGGITLGGDINFTKGAGFITANVKRPYVVIDSNNFNTYFKPGKPYNGDVDTTTINGTYNGSHYLEGSMNYYTFKHDFSFSIILKSVPPSLNNWRTVLFIEYSGVIDNDFLIDRYMNDFFVVNKTTKGNGTEQIQNKYQTTRIVYANLHAGKQLFTHEQCQYIAALVASRGYMKFDTKDYKTEHKLRTGWCLFNGFKEDYDGNDEGLAKGYFTKGWIYMPI